MAEDLEEFRAVVKAWVEANNLNRRKLADACECALSTVDRWWLGTVIPGPNVRKFIVEWIRGQA